MILQSVKIRNFRNIATADYNLQHLNIFTGPNAKGKTNSILAIYWAMSDYLMDGSSDYVSFKPQGSEAEEVSVELEFDSFKLKKTYQEHWTKTRGSNAVILTGHDTNYFIDDVKYSVSEGKKLLSEKLGLASAKTSAKVDLLRAIVNPYYLAQGILWKDLRAFVIELVGDVDDQTVLNSHDELEPIREDLNKYKFDVTTIGKLYKQQIKQNSDEVEKQQNIVAGYKDVQDVDRALLGKAEANLTLIDNDIAALKVRQKTDVNPKVAELEKQITEARIAYSESLNQDHLHLIEMNKQFNDGIEVRVKELSDLRKKLTDLETENRRQDQLVEDFDYKIKLLKREYSYKSAQKEQLLKEWEQLDSLEYQGLIAVQKCPHCGEVLNQDELDHNKTDWETKRQKQLDEIVTKGQKLANEIENLNFQIGDLRVEVRPSEEFEQQAAALNTQVSQLNEQITSLREQLTTEYTSAATVTLLEQGQKLKAQLEEEKQAKTGEDLQMQIEQKQANKEPYNKVIADHNAFLVIQDHIKTTQAQIKVLQEAQVLAETKLILIEGFIKIKLDLLKNNVSSVFENLEFVLVETNIKEGSYNEVCYPLILGTETPFTNGSGAEKIITGIYIIECIKRRLQLPDLPIIFDEVDKLDTNTLSTKLNTAAQIISTKVDDINYERVTLVSK